MNITELFPKSPSKASLKRSGVFKELQDDVDQCTSIYQITRLRFVWSVKASKDGWQQDWIEAAEEQFDQAVDALAAQQAEHE